MDEKYYVANSDFHVPERRSADKSVGLRISNKIDACWREKKQNSHLI